MPSKQSKKTQNANLQVDIEYRLEEFPTPFHGAGAVGIKILTDYLRSVGPFRGECELTSKTVTLRLSQGDVEDLIRALYASEVSVTASPEGSLDEEGSGDNPEPKKKGTKATPLSKEKPDKAKEVIIPCADFLSMLNPSGSELPRNLYRKLLWAIRSGSPARKIYKSSAAQEKKVQEMWAMLVNSQKRSSPQDIAGHDLLGAQSRTSDMVPMYGGEGRLAFLLLFWTIAAWVYPVICQDSEGALGSEGYAVAVPVVGNLKEFADTYIGASRSASGACSPHFWMKSVPHDSVIPLPQAAALDSFLFLQKELEQSRAARALSDGYALCDEVLAILCATEVYYLARSGRSHQVRDVFRLAPQDVALNRFERARKTYRNSMFLRRVLQNILAGASWFTGFDREISSLDSKYLSAALGDSDDPSIHGRDFFMDAEKAFDQERDPSYVMDTIVCSIAEAYVTKYAEERATKGAEKAEQQKEAQEFRNDGARKAFYQFRHMPLSLFPSKFIEEIGDLPLKSYFGNWEILFDWLSENNLLLPDFRDTATQEGSDDSSIDLGGVIWAHRHIITAHFNMALRKDTAAIKSIWLLALGRMISK